MSEQVLASKLVSAQIVQTEVVRQMRMALEGGAPGTQVAGLDLSGHSPLLRGVWVSGRAVLTPRHLRFEPGPLTRLVNPEPPEISIELRRVLDVDIRVGLLRAVCITAADVQVRMLCHAARTFADDIRDAVHNARPGRRAS